MRGSRRYGWDKGSVTHGHTDGRTYGRTDGRTYTEGRTIYVSRRGRHIIIAKIRCYFYWRLFRVYVPLSFNV